MTNFGKILTISVTLFGIWLLGTSIHGAYFANASNEVIYDHPKPRPPFIGPVITKEIRDQIRIYGTDIETYKHRKGIHPASDLRFTRKYKSDTPIAELRKVDYGIGSSKTIPLYRHKGGKRIDKKTIYAVLSAVVQRMPNMKTTQELLDFGYHTLLIETGCGRDNYANAVNRYNNFGIAQFRVDTAISTMQWLKDVRPDVHEAVNNFYDPHMSMEDNLLTNVPFSVALMYQYYWRRVPNFQEEIACVEAQGALYKAHYNSPKGLATINAWMERLEGYKAQEIVAAN